MTHNLAKKIRDNNVMLKVDLDKTFDRVNWAYYSRVLSTFGFSATVVSIFRPVSQSLHFPYALMAHVPTISPLAHILDKGIIYPHIFLFLVKSLLSKGIHKLIVDGHITPYIVPRGYNPITHILIVDDLLVCTNGSKKSLQARMTIITHCENVSGQKKQSLKVHLFCIRMFLAKVLISVPFWLEFTLLEK